MTFKSGSRYSVEPSFAVSPQQGGKPNSAMNCIHIEQQIEAQMKKGLRREEARYTALSAMHGVEQRKEEAAMRAVSHSASRIGAR
jgi:hypothetical protein